MATGHCGQVPEPHYIRMVVYRFNFFSCNTSKEILCQHHRWDQHSFAWLLYMYIVSGRTISLCTYVIACDITWTLNGLISTDTNVNVVVSTL